MVATAELFVVGLQPNLVDLVTYEKPLPATGDTIEDIYKKIPVSCEVHAEDAALEWVQPLVKHPLEILAREHSVRILT